MVRGADLHEHSNDDSEEPRQFRHGDTLHRRHVGLHFVRPTCEMSRAPRDKIAQTGGSVGSISRLAGDNDVSP